MLLEISHDMLTLQEYIANATFSNELIRVARTRLHATAIYHQREAGNCLDRPSDACSTVGIGPRAFDCSGLILRSVCDVLGTNPNNLRPELRHVRDMWAAAQARQFNLKPTELAVGALVVTPRTYQIEDGTTHTIPGHIGIVTDVSTTDMRFIHASPRCGRVEEAALRMRDTIFGYIALNLS